jgi:hypothetical protein
MVLGFGHPATSRISSGEMSKLAATGSKKKLAARNKRLGFID